MKKFIFIFLINLFTFAQTKTGTVKYSLVIQEDSQLSSDKFLKDYFKSAMENSKYVSLTLDFNQNEMVFYADDSMNLDGQDINFSLAFGGVSSLYYKDKANLVYYSAINNPDFGKIVIKEDIKIKWTLVNETKMINNYLCYKATSTKIIDNGKQGIFTRPVIAWYCPEIPVPFGPKEYGGLPGLILELQEKNLLYGVTKIDFDPKKEVVITKPEGKILTQNEFKVMTEELFKKRSEE